MPLNRPARRQRVYTPVLARYMVSTEGVAEPRSTSAFSRFPRKMATSLAQYRGVFSDL